MTGLVFTRSVPADSPVDGDEDLSFLALHLDTVLKKDEVEDRLLLDYCEGFGGLHYVPVFEFDEVVLVASAAVADLVSTFCNEIRSQIRQARAMHSGPVSVNIEFCVPFAADYPPGKPGRWAYGGGASCSVVANW